jgi:murein hydrolase activator
MISRKSGTLVALMTLGLSVVNLGIPAAYSQNIQCTGERPTLVQPVDGVRIIKFGESLPSGKTAQGTLFGSATGAAVVSPAQGRVTFADTKGALGLVIVIDVGCGRDVAITGASRALVQVGDKIDRGSPVATMPSVPSRQSASVYVEMREKGRVIDPGL